MKILLVIQQMPMAKASCCRKRSAFLGSREFKVAIVRPPLVFGPGVKGNMLRLMKLLDSKWPMPFEVAHSKRSMVNVANLKAMIERIVIDRLPGSFMPGR